MDRAGRVFAKQNTTNISGEREKIQAEVTEQVFRAVRDLFGIEPHSLQVASIDYSQTFVESNELAVRAKNEAIAEENRRNVATAVAQQKVITAQGERDAAIASAQGRAQSAIIEAKADKEKQVLTGEGNASRMNSEIRAFGDPKVYVEYLKAQAAMNWNGEPPQVMAGGNSSAPVVVPVPMGKLSP